jgi:hypothetical protein
MKRFLLTAALILAVVTSLTAGTLASYNQTLSINGEVTSKKFEISAAGGSEFNSGISVSPGTTQWYKFTVSNGSDVAVKLKAKASISTELAPVVNAVVYEDKTKVWATDATVDLDSAKTSTFYVKVSWPTDNSNAANARDNSYSNKSATLNVKVNGSYADDGEHEAKTETPKAFVNDTVNGF